MTAADHAGHASELTDHIEQAHRNLRGGGARAAVFGVSDGLVSNAALLLGVDGAHPGAATIRMAGIAGLLAGAFSMAAGEYVSMRAQTELLERELELERRELLRRPAAEHAELSLIYERRGIPRPVAAELATAMMDTPEHALATHAREELGIDPEDLGSPWAAAAASFVAFAVGAAIPLAGFSGFTSQAAQVAALVLTVAAACALGIALSVMTATPWWRGALRQLALCGVALSVSFVIGSLIGTGHVG